MAEIIRYTVVYRADNGYDARVVAYPINEGFFETENLQLARKNVEKWNQENTKTPYRVVILENGEYKEINADEDFSTRIPKKINSLIIWLRS